MRIQAYGGAPKAGQVRNIWVGVKGGGASWGERAPPRSSPCAGPLRRKESVLVHEAAVAHIPGIPCPTLAKRCCKVREGRRSGRASSSRAVSGGAARDRPVPAREDGGQGSGRGRGTYCTVAEVLRSRLRSCSYSSVRKNPRRKVSPADARRAFKARVCPNYSTILTARRGETRAGRDESGHRAQASFDTRLDHAPRTTVIGVRPAGVPAGFGHRHRRRATAHRARLRHGGIVRLV